MFLKLTESLSIECYINVDFVSLYHGVEDNQDPVSVKLYTGCTIIFASYPLLLFVSKLQTEVTLFTIYDEYVVLSQSHCGPLPLKSLVTEVFTANLQKCVILYAHLYTNK